MYNTDSESKTNIGGDVPVIVILSGPRRGRNVVLDQKTYRIVLEPDEALYILAPDGKRTENFHATLHHVSDTYELEVAPDHNIWINGEQVKESQALKSGDMLEIGHTGPVARYRIYHKGEAPWKTLTEALIDSMDGASADGKTRLGKMSRFLSNVIRDITTQTTFWFRFWVLVVLSVLILSVVMLIGEHMQLQKRIAVEDVRIGSIEEKLEEEEISGLTRQNLLALQAEVKSQLSDTMERLEVLEAGTGKASQLIAAATPSVIFLIGAYGYAEPGSGRLFHYVESGGGKSTRYTLEEEGTVLEIMFTGTAFVVTESGMLLTNLHVVEPWRNEEGIEAVQGRGLEPVILRLFAYYPGSIEPHAVSVIHTSRQADLVLLGSHDEISVTSPLVLGASAPKPGDEVLLLGYPTGLRALVARASPEYLQAITQNGRIDFWILAQRLSEDGYIKPLASRGIVSQLTDKFVVYDAETTFGGSGGPVLNFDGRVIGVNAAIIPEFGGSNMGIPADHVRTFLEQTGELEKE